MLKRLLKIILRLLLGLVVLVALLFAAVQTPPAKRFLAHSFSDVLSRPASRNVQIEGLTGFVPFRLGVERISVADGNGPWLEVEGADLRWAPRPLLEGVLDIERIAADRVEIMRRPESGTAPAPDEEDASFPIPLKVRTFTVRELIVDPSVAGMPVSLAISGRVSLLNAHDADAEVNVRYTLGTYETSEATLQATYDGKGFSASVSAQLPELPIIQKTELQVDVQFHQGEIRADVRLDSPAARLVDLSLHGSLSNLSVSSSVDLGGILPITFTFAGTLAHTDAGTAVRIEQAEGAYRDFTYRLREAAILRRENDILTLPRLLCEVNGVRVGLSGSLSNGVVQAQGSCPVLPLEIIPGLAAFTGDCTVHAVLSGTLAAPVLEATASSKGIHVLGETWSALPPASATLSARLDDSGLQVEAEGACEEFVQLQATASWPAEFGLSPFRFALPVRDPGRIRLNGEANLDGINQLPLLADQLLAGTLQVNLEYDGETDSWRVSGPFGIESGGYEHVGYGMRLTDIAATFDVEEKALVLREATARAGEGGTVSARGRLSLSPQEDQPFELEVDLRHAALIERDDLSCRASGGLRLTGDRSAAEVKGTITVDEGSLLLDRLPQSVTPGLEVVEVGGEQAGEAEVAREASPGGRSIGGRIEVTIPGPFVVQSGLLDSSWTGELAASREDEAWALVGALHARRGTVTFLGRPFTLTRGSLYLQGGIPARPTLDVEAEHERADLVARVRVRGLLEDPSFDLSSVPDYPDDEIISRILFGRSTTTITPLQAAQIGRAVASMEGRGGSMTVTERVQDTLGVDRVEIRESAAGDGTQGSAEVVAGRYLSNELYLTFNQSLAAQGTSVRVEYELTPRLSVETEAGTRLRPGIGLNWKFDY